MQKKLCKNESTITVLLNVSVINAKVVLYFVSVLFVHFNLAAELGDSCGSWGVTCPAHLDCNGVCQCPSPYVEVDGICLDGDRSASTEGATRIVEVIPFSGLTYFLGATPGTFGYHFEEDLRVDLYSAQPSFYFPMPPLSLLSHIDL